MNNWDKYQENILKKWSSMAKTYSTMHSISSEYYSTWDKRLGIPVILLGAAASSSIFTTSSESDINNLWAYINGGMVLLMTGISGISKFLGTYEKQAKHTSASFKYTHISMNIDTLLSFPRHDREEEPRRFINETKISILEVREHAPYLPTWVVSDYIKKLDKTITNTQTNVNRHRGEYKSVYNRRKKLNEWSTRGSNSPPNSHTEYKQVDSVKRQNSNQRYSSPLNQRTMSESSEKKEPNQIYPITQVSQDPTTPGGVVLQVKDQTRVRTREQTREQTRNFVSSDEDESYTSFLGQTIDNKMVHISAQLECSDSQDSLSDMESEDE